MLVFISQIIGFAAFLVFIISIQQKEKTKILFWQIVSFFGYVVQYLLINAYSGMVVYTINMLKSIVFYYATKKNKKDKIIPLLFICISLISGMGTYKEKYDLIPIINSILSIIFIWQSSIRRLRIGQIVICLLWIIYNVFVQAYVGVLTESLIIITTIIALIRDNYNIMKAICLKIQFKAEVKTMNFSNALPVVSSINLPSIYVRNFKIKEKKNNYE